MSAGSPERATQRKGPRPSQNWGRMKRGTKPAKSKAFSTPPAGRLGPEVVAVVEDDRAARSEGEHRPDVGGHPLDRPALVDLGLGPAQDERVGQRHLGRHVAAERVVGRRLVGHDVEALALLRPGRLDLGGIADEGDRERLPVRGRQAGQGERRLGRIREPVDVADLVPPAGPRLVDLDGDDDAVVHRDRRAAGRRPSRRGPPSGRPAPAASRRSAGGPARRTSRRCPAGSPGSRCRSRSRPSSGRTSSGRPAPAPGSAPRWPTSPPGSSSR